MIVAFYLVYSAIRNANEGAESVAEANAHWLIDVEKAMFLYHEQPLQEWALNFEPLIIAMNYFYSSFHFVVTAGAGIWLYRRFSDDYPLWRNTLGVTTASALVGFILWPLMPPRLLEDGFGYVDTLAQFPTFWSFNSGAVAEVSNQFAAMPSLHCAWALWVACVIYPRARTTAAKAFAVAYPVLTVVAITLTGNHYFLDAVGGFAVLGIGYAVARVFTRAGRRRHPDPAPDHQPPHESRAHPREKADTAEQT